MVGLINNWQGDIARAKTLTEQWPAWVLAQKTSALSQLEKMVEPNRKMEIWRYSDSAKLLNANTPTEHALELDEIEQLPYFLKLQFLFQVL